ncbi:DUF4382 domain-containing protein [Chitinophaga vietnamensis]|uniref:DUF4382 domain-containing protein n=1 Tax=Chitinophaga vietnamensis TaxID=2593957 RepID=UPI001177A208|nr:DUF4382 domain-containing protein [Chitinophaga vietnamensis]
MKNQITLTFAALAAAATLFTSCSKNDDNSSGNARMTVLLTDAPSPYDAVNVDVQGVQVNASSDASTTTGWQSLQLLRPGVYNLLKFRNGLDTVIASQGLPAGQISQIRLVLGTNNSVVIGGTSYPLETPSAQQSGLKLNLHANLTAGVEYRLWLDFDANRSVVMTGNGKFMLKPVIRAYSQADGGSIKGVVLPPTAVKGIFAIQGTDTVASSIPDPVTGVYLMAGISAGTYNVAIAGNGTVKDTTVTNVNVSTGQVTSITNITLHP